MTRPMDKKNRRIIESMLTNALKGITTFDDVVMTSHMKGDSIEISQEEYQNGAKCFDVEKELTLTVKYTQRIDLNDYFSR